MERIHVEVPGEQPQDREYMKQALALAENGHGWVNPNPMVGAVLVKDGRIIGEGYHTRYGQLHAEREAFKNAAERGEETAGADLYVTLGNLWLSHRENSRRVRKQCWHPG